MKALIFLLISCIGSYSFDCLFKKSEDFIVTELQRYYFEYYQPQKSINNYRTCCFINSYSYISNWFIKFSNCPTFIINNKTKRIGNESPSNAQGFFIFLEQKDNVTNIIERFRKFKIWSATVHHYFIFVSMVKFNQTLILNRFLSNLWNMHLLNIAVIYVDQQLEVIDFNPFSKTLINITKNPSFLFSDKLANMHGFQLRVSLFEQMFLLEKKSSKHWSGEDFSMLKLITFILNATFKIIEPEEADHSSAYKDVSNNIADFCLNQYFHTYDKASRLKADYTYPHIQNEILLLLPYLPQANRLKILQIFEPVIWFVIVIMLLVIWCFFRVTATSVSCLRLFAVLLGENTPSFQRKKCNAKLLLIVFVFTASALQSTFNSVLISTIINPGKFTQIISISEVRDSKMSILSSKLLAIRIPSEYGIHKQFITASPSYRSQKLRELNDSYAYVCTTRIAKNFFQSIDKSGEKQKFYLLKEVLVPGLNTYIFQNHSPYTEKISSILMLQSQYGISNKFNLDISIARNNSSNKNDVVLEWKHLEFCFYLLFGGWVISFLAFVVEVNTGLEFRRCF